MDLTSNFFVLCTNVKVYLIIYNFLFIVGGAKLNIHEGVKYSFEVLLLLKQPCHMISLVNFNWHKPMY